MVGFPDWNSIESVGRTQHILFWIGIGFFFLVLVAEVAAQVYSVRKDTLTTIRDDKAAAQRQSEKEESEKRHQADMADLQSQTDETHFGTRIIAAQTGQRSVSQALRKKMVSKLSIYPHQKFQILFPFGDAEAENFGDSIAIALANCGWDRSAPTPPYPVLASNNISDALIVITNEADTSVSATQAAAKDFGLVCNISPGLVFLIGDNPPRETIAIFIPKKTVPITAELAQKFAKAMHPSSLSSGILKLSPALRAYSGQTVSIYSPFYDPEADRVSAELSASLQSAGWKIVSPVFNNDNYTTNFDNMAVGFSEADAKDHNYPPEAAVALFDALKRNEIIDGAATLKVFPGLPSGEVRVLIGLSPFAPIKNQGNAPSANP